LDEVEDEEWSIAVGMELGNQIRLYNNQSEDKVGYIDSHVFPCVLTDERFLTGMGKIISTYLLG
jgi:hypothetical protein